jgi:hypothetical protein
VILGAPTDLIAKWTTAAAILADPGSRGASYIDVRLPDRPVAGGLVVAPLPLADQPTAPPVQLAQPGVTATTPAPPATSSPPAATGPAAVQSRPQTTTTTPPPATPATGTGGTAPGTAP